MEWSEAISRAVAYMEAHITEEITVEDVARQVYISPFYFQKGFSLLCGFTVAEYIRNRRLSLAGNELATSEKKVIDVNHWMNCVTQKQCNYHPMRLQVCAILLKHRYLAFS